MKFYLLYLLCLCLNLFFAVIFQIFYVLDFYILVKGEMFNCLYSSSTFFNASLTLLMKLEIACYQKSLVYIRPPAPTPATSPWPVHKSFGFSDFYNYQGARFSIYTLNELMHENSLSSPWLNAKLLKCSTISSMESPINFLNLVLAVHWWLFLKSFLSNIC